MSKKQRNQHDEKQPAAEKPEDIGIESESAPGRSPGPGEGSTNSGRAFDLMSKSESPETEAIKSIDGDTHRQRDFCPRCKRPALKGKPGVKYNCARCRDKN